MKNKIKTVYQKMELHDRLYIDFCLKETLTILHMMMPEKTDKDQMIPSEK